MAFELRLRPSYTATYCRGDRIEEGHVRSGEDRQRTRISATASTGWRQIAPRIHSFSREKWARQMVANILTRLDSQMEFGGDYDFSKTPSLELLHATPCVEADTATLRMGAAPC